MESKQVIAALAALAQEHRLAAFRYLVQCGTNGASAGTIADSLGLPASSMSFHLAHLERTGLVLRVRKSRSLIYSADFTAMNTLLGYLMENCCAGAACAADIERHVA
jgi:ArsR family transcriptional regulator, arsenate/arsenite/antimonite-responsive transcriptional repressor